jgi:hypothetical protein
MIGRNPPISGCRLIRFCSATLVRPIRTWRP